MVNELSDSPQRKILESLIELNQWEWSNVPVLNSVIGRHVYFCIATELISRPQEESFRSLKRIFNHPEYTDRAIRLKLREMEKAGLISIDYSNTDKRVRFLVPTPELIQIVAKHTKCLQRLLDKKFMILEK